MVSYLTNRPSWPILAIIPVLFGLRFLFRPYRPAKVRRTEERVLVLGASSGIGREIAHQYAARGARVCVVGRRELNVKEVAEECKVILRGGRGLDADLNRIYAFPADFSNPGDMVHVRTLLEKEWGGLDTLIVAAGVSALKPLMNVAGVEFERTVFHPPQATQEGIEQAVNIAQAACTGNIMGPLTAALTFIPLVSRSSKSPAILLVSSLAAVVPAPTRSLYAATKAASLILYQALSIEHPSIAFSVILPSTVEGDFRASAVDSGLVREANPNKHGLKRDAVASRCIKAIDRGEKAVFMPLTMKMGFFLYWLWPAFVEWRARKKYNFTA